MGWKRSESTSAPCAAANNSKSVILDATVRGGMGGVATIERLRSLDPKVNAIICSGYSDEAALSEFLAYGFRGALPKPFTRSELADALQTDVRSGQRELIVRPSRGESGQTLG